jgi:hypothetical protein
LPFSTCQAFGFRLTEEREKEKAEKALLLNSGALLHDSFNYR